jgi:hypothetical protein
MRVPEYLRIGTFANIVPGDHIGGVVVYNEEKIDGNTTRQWMNRTKEEYRHPVYSFLLQHHAYAYLGVLRNY